MSALFARKRVLKAVCENCQKIQFSASLCCEISSNCRFYSRLVSNRHPTSLGNLITKPSFSGQYLSAISHLSVHRRTFANSRCSFSKENAKDVIINETSDEVKASDKKLFSALARKRNQNPVKRPAIIPYSLIPSIFRKSVFAFTSRHFEVIEALEREKEMLFTTEAFRDMIKEEFLQLSNALFTCDFDGLKDIATSELIREAQNKIQGFGEDEKDVFLYELGDVLYVGAESVAIYDGEGNSMNRSIETMPYMDRWRLLTKPHFVEPLEDIRKAVVVAKLWCHTAVSGLEEPSIDRGKSSLDGSVITVRVAFEQTYQPEMRYLIGVSVERNIRKFLGQAARSPRWTMTACQYGHDGQTVTCDPGGLLTALEQEDGTHTQLT